MKKNGGLHSIVRSALIVIAIAPSAGCSDFIAPSGQYAMTHPWDVSAPISRGTTKAEILEKWGQPDTVIPLGVDELGLQREEWVYQAKADVPIDYRYLSKTKRIVFTGDHVTGWEDEAAQDGPTHH